MTACRAMLVIALLAFGACAPKRHTVEPYRSDSEAAAALEVRAAAFCAAQERTAEPPIRPFVTDGCSIWGDGPWVECCIAHDIPYWCGGTRAQRVEADRRLRECVVEKGPSGMGPLMHVGTRVGGHPVFPTYWRWGFGRAGPSCYDPPVE